MTRRTTYLFGLLGALGLAAAGTAGIDITTWVRLDNPAIRYYDEPANDAVAKLGRQIEAGEVKLDYTPGRMGYLPSLLKHLNVNIDSQVLVFSKTSFQAVRISPAAPRAIFFNDTVTVGSVQGGEVYELAALDPKQGIMFYTFDMRQTPKPVFDRRDVCMQCHQGPATEGVPGIIVASVFPGGDGTPAFRSGFVTTDHRTPFEERWGGWYVTGTHGLLRHRGNAVGHDPHRPEDLDQTGSQNLISLDRKVNVTGPTFLTNTSDIVALMTLEHQTRMTNLITRVGWDTRVAVHDGKMPEFSKRLDDEVDELVTYMLFADEAHLHDSVEGVSTFSKTFPERGPRDHKGRSLRDFDLHTRLFRYPMSYMIYSEAFDSLPDEARERIYHRLHDVLTGADRSPKFAKLAAADRQAVLEILQDTKPNLPVWWGKQAPSDAVARLNEKIQNGQATLEYADKGLGYLPALLKALNVNVDSQVLVFSKTSFQSSKISPKTPRAIFFNDEVSVGSVHDGEVLELAALDPKQGTNFYTLDVRKADKPRMERRDICLECHQGRSNFFVPGLMVDSVYPDADGMPLYTGGDLASTDHRSRFEDRWGGWYVTGTHGSQRHMGNAIAPNHDRPGELQQAGTQNLTSLAGKFDPAGYMSLASDIVALMALEHQTRMTNLMISVGKQARAGAAPAKLDASIEELVTYMLFADEARLTEPVRGVSTFTTTFPERGPRDKQGRSLRDFDLKTRLFRYPLSWMVYSEAFEAIPDAARERIYHRLHDVLTGVDQNPKFAGLATADRQAALEILQDTKPNLPTWWQ